MNRREAPMNPKISAVSRKKSCNFAAPSLAIPLLSWNLHGTSTNCRCH